jgi:hypothetical protein
MQEKPRKISIQLFFIILKIEILPGMGVIDFSITTGNPKQFLTILLSAASVFTLIIAEHAIWGKILTGREPHIYSIIQIIIVIITLTIVTKFDK